ncbi:MAG: Adaptive-response sensory-kinase SasA [Myxococcota bacterium]|nr:Adaptive-response sensory-kinase SasA [Myxococcota bacterium]
MTWRPGKFEVTIAAALALPATIALAAGLWLAGDLAHESLRVGVNDRVRDSIRENAALYRDVIRLHRDLFKAEARALAAGGPWELPPDRTAEFLKTWAHGRAWLRRVEWRPAQGEAVSIPGPNQAPAEQQRVLRLEESLPRGAGEVVVEAGLGLDTFQRFENSTHFSSIFDNLENQFESVLAGYQLAFLLVFGGIVCVSTIAGFMLARRITMRVRTLTDGVENLARGRFSQLPVRGSDEIAQLTISFNDMVRELDESRGRILYLERISSWQEIARRMAHEIKNPLTPIRLALQQLNATYTGNDPHYRRTLTSSMEIVEEEIGALSRLVTEFSQFARLPSAAPEPVELNQFIEEYLNTNGRFAARAEVSFIPTGGTLSVAVDAGLFRQALNNLVDNACEACQGRAVIRLQIFRRGRHAVLRISDNGPGIPPDARDRVFEPYFTTKEHGSGLGLPMARKTILEMNGDIRVVNPEPGGGAAMEITLPLLPGPPAGET